MSFLILCTNEMPVKNSGELSFKKSVTEGVIFSREDLRGSQILILICWNQALKIIFHVIPAKAMICLIFDDLFKKHF